MPAQAGEIFFKGMKIIQKPMKNALDLKNLPNLEGGSLFQARGGGVPFGVEGGSVFFARGGVFPPCSPPCSSMGLGQYYAAHNTTQLTTTPVDRGSREDQNARGIVTPYLQLLHRCALVVSRVKNVVHAYNATVVLLCSAGTSGEEKCNVYQGYPS